MLAIDEMLLLTLLITTDQSPHPVSDDVEHQPVVLLAARELNNP